LLRQTIAIELERVVLVLRDAAGQGYAEQGNAGDFNEPGKRKLMKGNLCEVKHPCHTEPPCELIFAIKFYRYPITRACKPQDRARMNLVSRNCTKMQGGGSKKAQNLLMSANVARVEGTNS
jgi:hypothetical protein